MHFGYQSSIPEALLPLICKNNALRRKFRKDLAYPL